MPRIREINRVLERINPFRNKYSIFRKHQESLKKFINIEIISPLALPSINRFFNWINRKYYLKNISKILSRRFKIKKPIVWCFLATRSSYNLIDLIDPKLLIYNCTDNYQAGWDASKDIKEIEPKLIKKADLAVVTSDYLYQQKRKIREDIFLAPPGVNFELFQTANTGMFKGKIKRICFFGVINQQRINIDIIESVALAGFEVWIIGTIREKIKKLTNNIKLFETVEHELLPGYLKKCDCLILPYNINEYTDGIMPAKLYECFATGKPIIATPLRNIKVYKEIMIMASSPEEFIDSLNNINKLENIEKYNMRQKIAKKHSEENQFDVILELVLEKLAEIY